MMRRHARTLGALCTALLLQCAAPAVPVHAEEEVAVRLWASAERTRLVLETAAPLHYRAGSLTAPDRFFIDITGTLSPALVNRLDTHTLPPAYLSGLRAARHDEATLRVVFDLAAGIDYRIEKLKPIGTYRHRLVIDLTPQDAPDLLLPLLLQLEAKRAPAGDAPPFAVLIDPGHGGEDPGAVSPNNRYEKDLVLRIAKRLAQAVQRRGMQAVLTREGDTFIPLAKRVRIAQCLQVDAFVSVHADSVRRRSARGSSVYILSQKGASSKFARRLAREANLSDLMGGEAHTHDPGRESTLRQFSQDGKDRASRQLAMLMLANLGQINRLHSRQVESAGFAVLKHPSIPSVLVETAFLSNPVEEQKLLSDTFQQQLADALADALDTYRRHHHLAPQDAPRRATAQCLL